MKNKIKNYITKILGNNVLNGYFVAVEDLPFYLVEMYDFYAINIFQSKCIFMVAKGDNPTTATISKHIKSVMKYYTYTAIYVAKTLKSYERDRLIAKNIPFIAIDNQMYLPMFGIDLREHFKQLHTENKKTLSPLSQVLMLRYINGLQMSPLTIKHIVKSTNYSLMTANRAFNQLVDLQLATVNLMNREKQLSFSEDKTIIWKESLRHLVNPIKKTLLLSTKQQTDNIYRAGEMALSDLTMLAPPSVNQFAIGYKQWQGVKNFYHEDDEGNVKLEIWKYDPGLISGNSSVDRYSLYLSLIDNNDERVQMALKELIKT